MYYLCKSTFDRMMTQGKDIVDIGHSSPCSSLADMTGLPGRIVRNKGRLQVPV